MPAVTPSSEVNAVGQPLPLPAQLATAVSVVSDVAQRLAAEQATPAAGVSGSHQQVKSERTMPGSAGVGSEADIVTPPGGFQPGQVWLNNIFSPEMPAERPRWACLCIAVSPIRAC